MYLLLGDRWFDIHCVMNHDIGEPQKSHTVKARIKAWKKELRTVVESHCGSKNKGVEKGAAYCSRVK